MVCFLSTFHRESDFEEAHNIFTSLDYCFILNFLFYSSWITFFCYFICDISLLFEKINLEYKIADKSKNEIHLRNIHCIKEIDSVSHIFISNNSLIENESMQIEGFLLHDTYVELTEKEKTKIRYYFDSHNKSHPG